MQQNQNWNQIWKEKKLSSPTKGSNWLSVRSLRWLEWFKGLLKKGGFQNSSNPNFENLKVFHKCLRSTVNVTTTQCVFAPALTAPGPWMDPYGPCFLDFMFKFPTTICTKFEFSHFPFNIWGSMMDPGTRFSKVCTILLKKDRTSQFEPLLWHQLYYGINKIVRNCVCFSDTNWYQTIVNLLEIYC